MAFVIRNFIICVSLLICTLTCSKFEESHKRVCFPPHIDFRVTVDSLTQIVKIDSIVKINGPFSISWDFGNGTPSTKEEPVLFKYLNQTVDTTYNIKLTVTNNCQEISTWYKPVFIKGCLITPAFDTSFINKTIVTFVNKTNPGIKKAIKYSWNFGDGSPELISSNSSISHSFASQGNYKVRLTVTSACGENFVEMIISIGCFKDYSCIDCIKQIINSWNNITFYIDNPIGILNIKWDFGDGSLPFIGFNPPPHTFQNADNFVVTVTITNDCNKIQSPFQLIVPIVEPSEKYTPSSDLDKFSQLDNYHQVVFLNNIIYILKTDRSFYKFNLASKGISNLGLAQGAINERNKLKRDTRSTALFNFGDFGISKWYNKWDLPNNVNKTVTDVDCNENGGHVFTHLAGFTYSIAYNPLSKLYFSIAENKNNLVYFSDPKSIRYNGKYINYINDNCFGLIVDLSTYNMFFISPDGIVMTDSKGSFTNLFNYKTLTGVDIPIKKILIDRYSSMWLLNISGTLFKYNISTSNYIKVWPSGVNDFDIFTYNSSETEVVVAGNRLLEHLVKN